MCLGQKLVKGENGGGDGVDVRVFFYQMEVWIKVLVFKWEQTFRAYVR